MNSAERFFAKLTFQSQKKTRLMRQLQRLIRAGVPLTRSLTALRKLYSQNGKKPKEPLALMIGEWQRSLESGKSLSVAMTGWVTPTEQMIIEAGEQSDRLATALEDSLTANGSAKAIRKAIVGGLAYPILLVFALCFMLYGFSTSIVPTFETIVPPERWTGSAAQMYQVSQFITNWGLVVLFTSISTMAAIVLTLPIVRGPVRKHLDRLPPWSIYRITQGASFMISMRGFLSAGLPVPEALRRMAKSNNPYFRERVVAILNKINMGRNLGDAMLEAGHNFPDNDIAGEVSIYAGLDQFAESLDVLAKEWITGAVERAQTAAKVLNTVMLVLIAGTIGYIAMSMFELNNIIAATAQQ